MPKDPLDPMADVVETVLLFILGSSLLAIGALILFMMGHA